MRNGLSCSLFLILLSTAPAFGQVYKCVDKGKVTYSDTPCNGNVQSSRPQLVDNTFDSVSIRREMARQQAEEARQQRLDAADKVDDARSSARDDKTDSQYCKDLERASRRGKLTAAGAASYQEACLGVSSSYERKRPMPIPSNSPKTITNCDSAGCWDNMGNRYNAGAGGTMFRQDGKVCQQAGNMLQCN